MSIQCDRVQDLNRSFCSGNVAFISDECAGERGDEHFLYKNEIVRKEFMTM